MSEAEEHKEEETPRPDKTGRNLLILGSACIVLLLVVFGFWALQPEPQRTLEEVIEATLNGEETENNYLFNGFAFVRLDNTTWIFRWQRDGQLYDVPLRFGVRDVLDVPVEGTLNESFDSSNLYITFDPRKENLKWEALASAELSVNLATVFGVTPTAACMYKETEACQTRPIVTCQDDDKGVIVLREADATLVQLSGNCMILQGPGEELLRAVDRVLYVWYGVTEKV
jgi:hypothetical protein